MSDILSDMEDAPRKVTAVSETPNRETCGHEGECGWHCSLAAGHAGFHRCVIHGVVQDEWASPVPAPAEQAETPKPCRVCGGSGFVAQKRTIDDGWGEADSCPECDRQDEIAALRAEVARLTAERDKLQASHDGVGAIMASWRKVGTGTWQPENNALKNYRDGVVDAFKQAAEELSAVFVADAPDLRLELARLTAENAIMRAADYSFVASAAEQVKLQARAEQAEAENARLKAEIERIDAQWILIMDEVSQTRNEERQADRDTLRQEVEVLKPSKGEGGVGGWYEEGYYEAICAVLALLGERREEPTGPKAWDRNRDQDEECQCGHRYERHFDTYEDMAPVGCKYCDCMVFQPRREEPTQ